MVEAGAAWGSAYMVSYPTPLRPALVSPHAFGGGAGVTVTCGSGV